MAPGQTIEVERLPVEQGGTVELDKVLLVADQDKVLVGKPTVEGARVIATALGEEKGEKITVFKYKAKTRFRKKTGHRQLYTRLAIKEIVCSQGSKG